MPGWDGPPCIVYVLPAPVCAAVRPSVCADPSAAHMRMPVCHDARARCAELCCCELCCYDDCAATSYAARLPIGHDCYDSYAARLPIGHHTHVLPSEHRLDSR